MRWVAAAWLLFVPGQDKVVVEAAWPKGAVIACESTENRRATIEAETLEGLQRVNRVAQTVRTFTDTILAEKDGRPTKVERAFTTFTREDAEGIRLPGKPVKSPLQGKTIVMMKKGDAMAYEGADDIDAKELASERLRPDPFLASLPAEPIVLGRSWSMDGRALLDDMSARTSTTTWKAAEITATLSKLEGTKATVSYRFKVTGTTDHGETATFHGDARHVVETSTKRLLHFGMEAAYTVESGKRRVMSSSLVVSTLWTWR